MWKAAKPQVLAEQNDRPNCYLGLTDPGWMTGVLCGTQGKNRRQATRAANRRQRARSPLFADWTAAAGSGPSGAPPVPGPRASKNTRHLIWTAQSKLMTILLARGPGHDSSRWVQVSPKYDMSRRAVLKGSKSNNSEITVIAVMQSVSAFGLMDDLAIQIIESGRVEKTAQSLSQQPSVMCLTASGLADEAELATNHEL